MRIPSVYQNDKKYSSAKLNKKMISHQTLRRLVYFAAIADAGSIRGAARRLNLSVPVLSEALSELEAELGVTLAARTTRRFELSEAGVLTQKAAQQILDTARGLTDLTSLHRPLQGVLSMTVPVELAGFWLPGKVTDFCAEHPGVRFDIDVTDSVVDLRASKIEVAIRTEYVAPDVQSRSTENLPLVVVAHAPVHVDPFGSVDVPLIDSQSNRRLVATSRKGSRAVPLTFSRTHRVTNRAAALQLARAGLGAVMVMRGSIEDELASGALVEIIPDHDFGSIDLHAVYRDRLPGPVARAFVLSLGLDQKG